MKTLLRDAEYDEIVATPKAKKTITSEYRPILANDDCRWLVPRVDLSGCRMDTTVATIKEDGTRQLSLSNNCKSCER